MIYPKTPWRDRVFSEIDAHLETLGWDTEKARQKLIETFACTSRHQLTDAQLTQFCRELDWISANLTTSNKHETHQ